MVNIQYNSFAVKGTTVSLCVNIVVVLAYNYMDHLEGANTYSLPSSGVMQHCKD